MLTTPYKKLFFLPVAFLSIFLNSCQEQGENTESTPTAESVAQTEEKPAIDNTPPVGIDVPYDMVYIPEISYTRGNEKDLGTRSRYPEEAPEHQVSIKPFLIDKTEVTNRKFKRFVEETGYLTQAETGLFTEDFPDAPVEHLAPGATVFMPPAEQPELWEENSVYQWWQFIPGATWKRPTGPQSSIEDKMDHPVVCVTHKDAQAYAKWAGKRLPTEAEWEAAARGGLEGKLFTWGNQPMPEKKWMGNTFQGTFPSNDTGLDGSKTTTEVKSYPPNGFGLYDMAGNVWEHVSDYYRPDSYMAYKSTAAENPTGPTKPIDHMMLAEWQRTGSIPADLKPFHPLAYLYTSKGGSFLCHHSYCLRYRPAARHYSEGFTPTNHTGFRCAKDL